MVNFAAGGIATPADAALMMQLGCDGVFVGSGIFKSATLPGEPRPSSPQRPITKTPGYWPKSPRIWGKPWRGSK